MGKGEDPGALLPTTTPEGGAANVPTSRPASRSANRKARLAHVLLPDGTNKEFELTKSSEGEALFRQVTADLSIEEREYFSLCFYDKSEGGRHWLYNDKKIESQLKGLPWEFHFEVKFYPTAPSTLNDDHARYYLFLQLRKDILSGKLPATVATHTLLGSFVAQAEFGDAPQQVDEKYERYLRSAQLVPEATPDVLQKLVEFHKQHRGQTASDAENNYLDACRQLSMYGIHLFPAKDKENGDVLLGVGAGGIYVFKDQMRVHRFEWQSIYKISYRKNTFVVKLKPGEIQKNEATFVYKETDYLHAKRVWKCAVEHHTFFRLIQPEDKPKGTFLNFGSTRFRYHGRTQFQTKMASQMFDKPSTVDRTQGSRMSQSLENVSRQPVSPLHYTDTELEHQHRVGSPSNSYDVSAAAAAASGENRKHQHHYEKSKGKGAKKGRKESDSSETTESDDEKKNFAVVAFQESGTPHTTVSSWQETSELPEQVMTEFDEHGNKITRTIRTSQVKHTVQKQTFQNYIVDDVDQTPMGVVQVERSREQFTPIGQQTSTNGTGSGGAKSVIDTQTRTMTYDAPATTATNGGSNGQNGDSWAGEGLGEFVSSKTVTQGNRTIETITYKTEKDGIVETHVEHRVTIHSDNDIDHDAELSQAILDATQMNPDMTVERIEVRQETTQ